MEITTDQSAQPKFIKSIDELVAFSAAVDVFKSRFDDLQKHIESIQNAIDSNLKSNGVDLAASCSSPHPPLSPPRNNTSGETTVTADQLPQEAAETVPETSDKPEVERLCESMCSKGLRKYIQVNISNRAKLMSEIPAALKLAKEPAKFALECFGKFYLQGRKAFTKGSTIVSVRQVSLLILESLLLMPDPGEGKLKIKIGGSVKDQAEKGALAWRKRLMTEGGLAGAEKMDARGLLLLIACFGVPSRFRYMDLLDLIRRSGSNEIAGALRRSTFLVPMISGIVESGMKRGMHIEALEMVYTFGMEDKFSASSVLTAFLRMNKESFERAKQKAHSPMAIKEANEKQLAALSSVMKCMENHKLDPAKEIPGWQIKDQMVKLKEYTLLLNKEMEEKARSITLVEEAELSKRLYDQQMKRPRLSPPMEMPPVASSSYTPPNYYDRSILSRREEDNDEISALVSSYLSIPSSFPHRSNLRRSPEYVVSPGVVSAYEHLPPNSYSSVHGQRLPRHYSPAHGQRLSLQPSPPFRGQQQIPIGLQSVYRESPPVERYLNLPNHRSRSPRNS